VYTVGHSVDFGVVTVNIFSSVNRDDAAMVIGRIFLSNCLEWMSLARPFVSLSSGSLRFLSTSISQGSVATRLRCGGTFKYYVIKT